MKVINATTIGILISAHMEGDEVKFLSQNAVNPLPLDMGI